MQVPTEYLYAAAGAAAALALARFRGWLKVPFLDGIQAPQHQPSQSLFTPVYKFIEPTPVGEPQSYSAVIDIPHKITVTPQQGAKQ